MDERFLSFSRGAGIPSGLFYKTDLVDDELVLRGRPRQRGLSEGSPIKALVYQAQLHEWDAALAAPITALKELVRKEPNVHHVIEDLRRGPWGLFDSDGRSVDIFASCPALEPFDRATLDRRILAEANKILKRRTIILVPDYLNGAIIPTGHDVLKTMADELIQGVGEARDKFDIALVRLCRDETDEPGGQGLFTELMNALSSRTTQLAFADGIHRKEGPLLIEGATGTGKSQAASLLATQLGKTLHEFNLAAVSTSEDILEARMRGYRKGMFTGAYEDREGFFEQADGQVLFLDELQSASLASQTQLLDLLSAVSNRVRVSRLGEEKQRNEYSVKVILATNRPANELLAEGRLREDLFHRIRDVVRFKDLGTLLQETNYVERIFTLLRLYRWQSYPPCSMSNLANLRTELLFPLFKEGITEQIRSAHWPGNFRQFERFAHDLYWTIANSPLPTVSTDLVKHLLDRERERFGGSSPGATTTPASAKKRKALFVEKTLTSNGMNIARSLPELAEYKLKARSSLRSFMLNNRELFSAQFLQDSRIRAFMGTPLSEADGSDTPISDDSA